VSSIVCPNGSGGATVYGTWTEPTTQVLHGWQIDVAAGSTGSFTIASTRPVGAGGATYVDTFSTATKIQCS